MSGKHRNRFVRAVTDLLRERDRREMQAVGTLLSLIEQKPRRRHRPGPAGRKPRESSR
jgi:hypothetical protein